MRRISPTAIVMVVLSSLLASSLPAQGLGLGLKQSQQGPRRPRGIYAVVDVEQEITKQANATPSLTTPAQLAGYFAGLYQQVLADPAVSGLALQVHWDRLNPNPPGAFNSYDWTYLDLAFIEVAIWDVEHLNSAPKTIQLIVQPGFQSPQWLLNELPSCDPLFTSGTPPSNCGKATFANFKEQQDHNDLPLPWNPVYKNAWKSFLTALAGRYGWNPALVSIAVAGPTAASAEIILPSNSTAGDQTFGAVMIAPNDMWNLLFAFQSPPLPQNSDQVFVDEWNTAIDMYGQLFSGLTLTVATGDGLPNFTPGVDYAIPYPFVPACPNPDVVCLGQALILSHFIEPSVGGSNAKATQTSGMEASRANPTQPPHDMGVAAVKDLSLVTAPLASPSAQILGGAQFNTSFSNFPVAEGCLTTCSTPISPEQAEYNVLYVYFYSTPVAASFGGVPGATPLNYLQIYSDDIQYSEANAGIPAEVTEIDGANISESAQDLLNQASQKLFEIAEPPGR